MRTGYATRLIVNGIQVGRNDAFMDYYADDAEALRDTREFFAARYIVESVEIASLPRWEGTEPVPTVVVSCRSKAVERGK